MAKVIAEYSNGRELVEAMTAPSGPEPDLLIVDISMPEMDGLTAIVRIRDVHPAVRVLVYSMFTQPDLVKRVLDARAQGYVPKGGTLNQLLVAIEVLKKGKTYVPSRLRSELADDAPDAARLHLLTTRERQVAEAAAAGRENKEIAAELGLSVRTVEVHRLHAMRKLGARNLADLVRLVVARDGTDTAPLYLDPGQGRTL